MPQDHRKNVLAAAIAGLVGLGAIAATIHAERTDRAAGLAGGGGGYQAAPAAGPAARPEGQARPVDETPARRTLDDRFEVAEGERAEADALVGPAIVGPKRVGPKRVGPKIVGAKRVGPKIVGPRRAGPGPSYRPRGGGGGGIRDHIHYPPGWTRTPRGQAPGRNVE